MLKIYFILVICWIFLLSAGIILRKKRSGKIVLFTVYFIFFLFMTELTCLLALKIKTGFWLFNERYNPNAILFEPHPYLVSKPIPNAVLDIKGIHYEHNSEGWRGNEFKNDTSKLKIITIGGSTTYGTGVSNHQTWPYYLDSLISDKAEVMNFGISGHSTTEHLILSLFTLPAYHADIVLIMSGLNDLRNCYIKNPKSDYTNFHPYNLESVLGFDHINNLPRLAIIRVSVILLQKIGYYPLFSYQKVHIEKERSKQNEDILLNIYRQNLTRMVKIIQESGSKVVLLPQILNSEALAGNQLKWWVPFVADQEFVPLISKYNQVQQQTADSTHCFFIGEILSNNWKKSDFIDASHFNAGANLQFAKLVNNYINQTILNQ